MSRGDISLKVIILNELPNLIWAKIQTLSK